MNRDNHPGYMDWPTLRTMLHARFEDDEVQDDDLIATRAELGAVMAWVAHYERLAAPRRAEEQRAHDLIKRATTLMAERINEDLPEGLVYYDGEVQFQCISCGKWTEWPVEIEDFEFGSNMNLCGGSPRCCP